jgi:hypothetical protein
MPTLASQGSIGYEVIKAIIDQLPRDARWSPQRRERWLQALTAAIDLVVEQSDGGKEGALTERKG